MTASARQAATRGGETRTPAPTDRERTYYDESRRVYGSVFAAVYDLIVAPMHWLRRRVTQMARIAPGMRAIDVATGTGAQARAFAQAGASVVGLDLAPRMLAIARRKSRTEAIRFVEGDATRLPEPDDSFDIASISFALHEMPETIRERVVDELARVTRPGGTIVIVDHARPRNRIWAFLVEHVLALFERDSYREFLRTDLVGLVTSHGITIDVQRRVLFGSAQVIVGRRSARSGSRDAS